MFNRRNSLLVGAALAALSFSAPGMAAGSHLAYARSPARKLDDLQRRNEQYRKSGSGRRHRYGLNENTAALRKAAKAMHDLIREMGCPVKRGPKGGWVAAPEHLHANARQRYLHAH